jgi:hypothetical protein
MAQQVQQISVRRVADTTDVAGMTRSFDEVFMQAHQLEGPLWHKVPLNFHQIYQILSLVTRRH